MHKRILGRQFSRESSSRRALFRALVRALVESGSIKTTRAKAKTLQGKVDKLATTARKNTLASQRQLLATLGNDRVTVQALVQKFSRETTRQSGFTRIIPLPSRKGDNAAMARIEWVDKVQPKKEKPDNAKQKGTKTIK